MNTTLTKILLLTFFAMAFSFNGAWARTSQLFNEQEWDFSTKGTTMTDVDGIPAILFTRGELTYTKQPLRDGIVEFDLMTSSERAFFYVYFRELSEQDSEVIYIRTHKSNAPDTVQYAPVFQGRSAWQLYHGDKGTGAAYLPSNEWVHVKMQFLGAHLSLWLGDDPTPVFERVNLTRPINPGTITLRGNIPSKSEAQFSAYVRNISITPLKAHYASPAVESELAAGALTHFRVSPVFEANKTPIFVLPEGITKHAWELVEPQKDGVIEFLRWRTIPDEMRSYAVAADTVLISPKEQTCALWLGFSDTVTLMLNQSPLAFADASYRYDINRQEGLLHNEQMLVFLPLQKGENHLRAIVADSFGGWGLQATLADCSDVVEKTH